VRTVRTVRSMRTVRTMSKVVVSHRRNRRPGQQGPTSTPGRMPPTPRPHPRRSRPRRRRAGTFVARAVVPSEHLGLRAKAAKAGAGRGEQRRGRDGRSVGRWAVEGRSCELRIRHAAVCVRRSRTRARSGRGRAVGERRTPIRARREWPGSTHRRSPTMRGDGRRRQRGPDVGRRCRTRSPWRS
jgi:hypothetical protein